MGDGTRVGVVRRCGMNQDPRTSEPTSFPDEPHQRRPGLETEMRTKPDHGEESYVGKALLSGMAALITGGDSGIGRAVAIAYAREGADLAISYLADEQADAEETQRWVEQAGRRCLLLPGDIRDQAWCEELVEKTVDAFGRLDVLVNNAAAQSTNEDLADIEAADLEGAFRANVFAPLWLAQAAVPHMKPGASIINTTSVQAKVASKGMIVYSATKGALASLTIGLSNLLAPEGDPGELRGAGSGLDADPADREVFGDVGDAGAEDAAGPGWAAGRAGGGVCAAGGAGGELHVGGADPGDRRDADALAGRLQ